MKIRYNYFDREVKNELGNLVYTIRYKYNFSKGFIEIFNSDGSFNWWFRHGFYKRNYTSKEWNKLLRDFREFRDSNNIHF